MCVVGCGTVGVHVPAVLKAVRSSVHSCDQLDSKE